LEKKVPNKIKEQKGKKIKEKKSRQVEHTLNYPRGESSLEKCQEKK
jgi:hypothetical protein